MSPHTMPTSALSLPPRAAHLPLLRHHFTLPHPPPIFLHGPPHSGRLSTLLASHNLPSHATSHIDCVLSHSDRLLFAAATNSSPCDLTTFLSRLTSSPVTVLVFHRAERLARPSFSSNLLPVLFNLPRLARNSRLSVVLVSAVPWVVFRRRLPDPVRNPLVLSFGAYTESEVVDVIVHAMRHLPNASDSNAETDGSGLLAGFVRAIVAVLYGTTTDVVELRGVCEMLFPRYLEEFSRHRGSTAAVAAFNKIQGDLGAVLKGLYRRQYVPSEVVVEQERKRKGREEAFARLDLSRSCVTLLVAAYLAGTNPPDQDMRYFSTERTRPGRGRGRGRANARGRGGKARTKEREGGRVFPLERLLAIYDAIRDTEAGELVGVANVVGTSHLVQIATLVSLGYLAREGGDTLGEPKFRCSVSAEQATQFAQLVGVELHLYLHGDTSIVN